MPRRQKPANGSGLDRSDASPLDPRCSLRCGNRLPGHSVAKRLDWPLRAMFTSKGPRGTGGAGVMWQICGEDCPELPADAVVGSRDQLLDAIARWSDQSWRDALSAHVAERQALQAA